jgi:hypothetical protein
MGAGVQRWWRPTFAQECARHAANRSLVDHGPVRCVDEDGIECTLRLYTTKPMYHAVIKLGDP